MTRSGLNPIDYIGTVNGKDVKLYILTNNKGVEITILNYGARIVSLLVPDKNGNFIDIKQGNSSLKAYLEAEEPSLGAVCGQVTNRIVKNKLILDKKNHQSAISNTPNNFHEVRKGFQFVVWDAKRIDSQTLELTYHSKDKEENYTGNITAKVFYRLTDNNELDIKYEATTDKTTIVNLTNHLYFNLSGHNDKDATDHLVVIDAETYLPIEATSIPLRKPVSVRNTPFDFLSFHSLGERTNENFDQLTIGKGYDHYFVLNKKENEYNFAAECYSPKTGICMTIHTTEPGIQLYTANWLEGKQICKNGNKYPKHSSVCFETQHFPNVIDQSEYTSFVLKPNEKYESRTTFTFYSR